MTEALNPALESLAGEAATIEASATAMDATGSPEAAPVGPDNGAIIAGALTAFRDGFTAFTKMRSVKVALTDDRIQGLAAVYAPVCEKYGLDLNKYIGNYGPEIAAIVMTVTIGLEIRGNLRAEIAFLDSAKAAAAQTAETANATD
jgi:hypothetical protein